MAKLLSSFFTSQACQFIRNSNQNIFVRETLNLDVSFQNLNRLVLAVTAFIEKTLRHFVNLPKAGSENTRLIKFNLTICALAERPMKPSCWPSAGVLSFLAVTIKAKTKAFLMVFRRILTASLYSEYFTAIQDIVVPNHRLKMRRAFQKSLILRRLTLNQPKIFKSFNNLAAGLALNHVSAFA